jgi:hypothetical protein
VKRWALSPVPLSIEPIQADRVRTRNSRMDVQILCRHRFRVTYRCGWNFSALSKSNTKLAIELSMEFPEKHGTSTDIVGLRSVDPSWDNAYLSLRC